MLHLKSEAGTDGVSVRPAGTHEGVDEFVAELPYLLVAAVVEAQAPVDAVCLPAGPDLEAARRFLPRWVAGVAEEAEAGP